MARPKKEPVTTPDQAPQPSKAAMVREAMATGLDDNSAIQDWILGKYQIELPTKNISVYRSQEKARKTAGDQGKATATRTPRTPRRTPTTTTSNGATADLADRLQALKELVREIGADQAKKFVDLLS